MPAYMTHALHGEETYQNLAKEKLLETEVHKKQMTTFSLGIDLSCHDYITHNTKTQDFLLNFIKKVKEEKHIETSDVIAMLYGHICHYFLDTNLHPYIYYIEKGTQKVPGQFLSSHMLVEGYLSNYFMKERANESVTTVKANRFFTNQIGNTCEEILNAVYQKTYQLENITRNYRAILTLLLLGETVIKNTPLGNQKLCETVVSFQRFLKANELTLEEINNEEHELWKDPVSGFYRTANPMDLYEKSIQDAIQGIAEVNKYLYGSKSIEALELVFPNISYDTGENLNRAQIMQYTRKRTGR